jgi:hypothetical protein
MSDFKLWHIWAENESGYAVYLFAYTGLPENGIARAKRESVDFPQLGVLSNYHARVPE